MAVQILTRRSNVAYDRPFPIRLGAAELAINNNAGEPGLFFADNTASPSTGLVKVGPITISSTAPNTSAVGFTSSSKGESWLDTASTHIHKIFDGLKNILERENRLDLYEKTIKFINTRVELDFASFKDDVWSH